MSTLTWQKAEEFADDLNSVALALGNVRQRGSIQNGQELTGLQKDDLLTCQIKLLRGSASFSAMAITLDGEAIKSQLERLKIAAGTIDQKLSRVQDVQKIMDVGAAVTAVVDSVATGNTTAVEKSLRDLLTSVIV